MLKIDFSLLSSSITLRYWPWRSSFLLQQCTFHIFNFNNMYLVWLPEWQGSTSQTAARQTPGIHSPQTKGSWSRLLQIPPKVSGSGPKGIKQTKTHFFKSINETSSGTAGFCGHLPQLCNTQELSLLQMDVAKAVGTSLPSILTQDLLCLPGRSRTWAFLTLSHPKSKRLRFWWV